MSAKCKGNRLKRKNCCLGEIERRSLVFFQIFVEERNQVLVLYSKGLTPPAN